MSSEYVPTGVAGVDRILGEKGIPRGHTVLVSGGPGSGKTTFAIQFLYRGAVECDESGLYVSMDEDPADVKRNMANYGWDCSALEAQGRLAFVNVSPVRASSESSGLVQLGMKEFKLIKLLEAIRKSAGEIGAARIVIDPVTMFMLQYPDDTQRTYALKDLIAGLRDLESTDLLVSELKGTGMEREHQFEEYLAQGVIILRTMPKGDKLTRAFQVEKMRGLKIDSQPHPYEITDTGVEVYPTLTVFR